MNVTAAARFHVHGPLTPSLALATSRLRRFMPPAFAQQCHSCHSESSADRFGRFSRSAMLMLVMWLVIAPDGAASPVHRISTSTTNPIVPMTPDGGVLMLSLTAERHGDSWPRTLTVTLEDGRAITGRLAWIAPMPSRHDAGWTDSPLGLSVRDIRATDRTAAGTSSRREPASTGEIRSRAGTPFLLAELPPDARGTIQLLNQTLRPRWLTISTPGQHGSEPSDMLTRARSFDRPDPDHPLEYWRWVMLADRLGKRPPPPPSDPENLTVRLAALHSAQLWQAALDRVREQSRGVADHLRDLLTRICTDDDAAVSFAAWVADPVAVNSLLNTLVDRNLDGEQLINRALEWADRHERLMVWLESAGDRYARVAIVNSSFRPQVARLRWEDPDDIPIAVELPSGRLTRVRLERRSRGGDLAGDDDPVPEVLRIDVADLPGRDDELTYTLVLDVPVRPALPPGVYLPPLAPALTLASVQQGRQPTAPERYATTAQIRRLQGRWELFVEAHRPVRGEEREERIGTAGSGQSAVGNRPLQLQGDFAGLPADVFGRDAIVIFIGEEERDGKAHTIFAVSEQGDHQLVHGREHPTLRVHQRSFDDRWLCRIELPDQWLSAAMGEATHLGVMRMFPGNAAAAATSPMPAVPWRLEPGRLSFDLTRWDDVPRE